MRKRRRPAAQGSGLPLTLKRRPTGRSAEVLERLDRAIDLLEEGRAEILGGGEEAAETGIDLISHRAADDRRGHNRPGCHVHAAGLVEMLRFFKSTSEPTFAAAARLAALTAQQAASEGQAPPLEVRVGMRELGNLCVTVGRSLLGNVDAWERGTSSAAAALVASTGIPRPPGSRQEAT